MKILIGGAWPYANGSLHIGHVAALLPGDILARYYRLKGEDVCFISGSDCHGTPIQVRAKKENSTPEAIALKYHEEFCECFAKLGFSYDLYSSTENEFHQNFVKDFFIKLKSSEYLYKKTIEQAYCSTCNQFLPDRFVIGICPECGNPARGDQCDFCSSLLDPILLINRKCSLCGDIPEFRQSEHLFLALSKFEEILTEYISSSTGWRQNAINLSQRYINEGLRDRATTRDLDWGIDVPVEGFENKKIYVWIDAVLGYLSASLKWAESTGKNWHEFWSSTSLHYYIHGKDNIPFHTIILPALLIAVGDLHLPDRIISSEYLTLYGKKISTSNNWAIWLPYILEKYNPDSIRYFLTVNGPEKRDTDFSWSEFINSHNGELLGAYGNFVNRTLVFVKKYFNSVIPEGKCNKQILDKLPALYFETAKFIEEGNFKDAIDNIFVNIRLSNKFFDEEKPWVTLNEDINKCQNTIFSCVQIIASLSNLLEPFLPFSSQKIFNMLNIEGNSWSFKEIKAGTIINETQILFERIDKKIITEETNKMHTI